MNSLVNFSDVAYTTRFRGNFAITWLPIACIRWVFPRPTPPYRNNGLYACPGRSATDRLAACARRFADPTMKLEKVYRWLMLLAPPSPPTLVGSTRICGDGGGALATRIGA